MELANTMQDADARKLTAPMQMVFSDVVKKFDTGTVALDGIDLDVERGDFVAVVGPSGCGKSTLLRMAAGLERPTSGAVALDTESVGFIFQEPTLLPWRTVQANVELSAELGGGDKAARKLRADEAIRAVGLADFAKQLPNALSGGMKMRVSLARALTLAPAVMHSVSEAVYLANKVVVMTARPGRIHSVVDIDFPYPRSPELRYDARYTEHVAEISASLHGSSR
jgi:NitT/TauT family transport system ATP-binding protein